MDRVRNRPPRMPASCDGSAARTNNCQWPRSYQITTQQMGKAEIRRLIRWAEIHTVSQSALAEWGRGGAPKRKLHYSSGKSEEEDLFDPNIPINKQQYGNTGISNYFFEHQSNKMKRNKTQSREQASIKYKSWLLLEDNVVFFLFLYYAKITNSDPNKVSVCLELAC